MSKLSDWAITATPEDFLAADAKLVLAGIKNAQKELDSTGIRHSWLGPYVKLAEHIYNQLKEKADKSHSL
jgi:type IV secretory pathway TrbL component